MSCRSPTRRRSSPRIGRRSACTTTRKVATGRGLKVIIAGAGGAAHLPGMTASLTQLPVLGVPVADNGTRRPGQPLFHRADAGRRARRHARHRRDGRHQRRACSPRRSSRLPTQPWRSASRPTAPSAPLRSPRPRRTIEARRCRRAPRSASWAAASSGACSCWRRRASDSSATSTPTSTGPPARLRRRPRSAPSTTSRRSKRSRAQSTSSPTSSRTCRSRPRRGRERHHAGAPRPEGAQIAQDRLEEKLFVSRLGIAGRSVRRGRGPADFDARSAPSAAGDPEDAPLRLRRQGAGAHRDGGRLARRVRRDWPRPGDARGFRHLQLRGVGADRARHDDPSPLLRHPGEPPPRWHPAHLDRPVRALPERHRDRAREIAEGIADALDYVGVLAVEMFYVGGGAPEPLIVNEIAPRVHNSGHWTIDACAVSQFENHIRAVAGWPLGDHRAAFECRNAQPHRRRGGRMAPAGGRSRAPAFISTASGEARPGRKMGHVTWINSR